MNRYSLVNQSRFVQVIRTTGHHVERTVLPGQTVTVEADPEEYLEIYTNEWTTSLLAARMVCHGLPVEKVMDSAQLVCAG